VKPSGDEPSQGASRLAFGVRARPRPRPRAGWASGVLEYWSIGVLPRGIARRVAGGLQTRYVVSGPERLEGSRFVGWQLYGSVSRRLPGTSRGVAVLWPLYPPHGIDAMGKTLR
jgi:hypothetical protein